MWKSHMSIVPKVPKMGNVMSYVNSPTERYYRVNALD
jgi:hypothetical protein